VSFSFSVEAKVGDDLGEVIDLAVEKQLADAAAGGYEANIANASGLGMIAAAKEYINALAPKVANEGDTLGISISGHANPGKDEVPGWAANAIYVSISQRYATKEAGT
jgi:hypothetical protein